MAPPLPSSLRSGGPWTLFRSKKEQDSRSMLRAFLRFLVLGTFGFVAARLLVVWSGPGEDVEIRGRVLGAAGSRVAVVASRGDCLDPQRDSRVVASGWADERGTFLLVAPRASAGIGAVCAFLVPTSGPITLAGLVPLSARRSSAQAILYNDISIELSSILPLGSPPRLRNRR